MYRPADVDNPRDFNQYYSGSFISFKGEPNIPVQVAPATRDTDRVHILKMDKVGDTYVLREQERANFGDLLRQGQFGMPQYGACEFGPTVVYSSRGTPRNGGRGLRGSTLRLHVFCADRLPITHDPRGSIRAGVGLGHANPYYHKWVWDTFNPSYAAVSKAWADILEGKRFASPLSRTLTIYGNPEFTQPVLAYKETDIGVFESNRKVVLSAEFKNYLNTVKNELNIEVSYE